MWEGAVAYQFSAALMLILSFISVGCSMLRTPMSPKAV